MSCPGESRVLCQTESALMSMLTRPLGLALGGRPAEIWLVGRVRAWEGVTYIYDRILALYCNEEFCFCDLDV
jgi:hypothetical protein